MPATLVRPHYSVNMELDEGRPGAVHRVEAGIRALITGGVLHNHEVAARVGLHVLDLQVLNLLAVAGGRMTPSALAAAMHTPRSSISRIVRRLEAAGYVHRTESRDDGRSVTVHVDAERLVAITGEYRQQSDALHRALAGVDDDEVGVIARFLEGLVDPDRRSAAGRRDGPRGEGTG
ncbi:MarR family transcriptional regulator [Pseudactinotalea sp. HY160]|nr:MarR family transcriptional regulator [Pseudactinotalea sp. HY160]